MPSTLSKLLYLLGPADRWRLAVLFALMVVAAGLEMVGLGAIPAFVALVADPDRLFAFEAARAARDLLGSPSPERLVLYGAAALAVLYVAKNAYLAVLSYWQFRFLRNRTAAISARLFARYLESPYPFHLQRNSAELQGNVQMEAQRAVFGVLFPCLQIAKEGLLVVAVTVLLLLIDPLVTLIVFLALGAASVAFYRAARARARRAGGQEHDARAALFQAVNEGLGAIKVVKVTGKEGFFLERFRHQAYRLARAMSVDQHLRQLPRLALETFALVGLLLVTVVFLAQGRSLQAILPFLALVAAAVVRLIPSYNQLTSAATQLRYNSPAVDAVHRDLVELERARAEPRRRPRPDALPELPLERAVTFERVAFRYPGNRKQVLFDLDLAIPAGAAVAFVGPTGAGKTTAVDILLGLLEPTAGRVLVDGRDIHASPETLAAWQRRIGYVPQETFLIDDTLRRNIAFGVAPAAIDEEAVRRAVDMAQLKSLLAELPDGLDTELGERGLRLSGGQRQRVGIARALYHRPRLLVLDEATSSLDHETEAYLMQAIRRLRGSHTLVLIAHRLKTVADCDTLFFLREGRLAAQGSLAQLSEASPEFRRMVAIESPVGTEP